MHKRYLQIMALAVLSLIAFLAKPLPTIYAQTNTHDHIRFRQTETGLVITWDPIEGEGFIEYIVDVYNTTHPRNYTILFCIETFDSTTTTIPASIYAGRPFIVIEVLAYFEVVVRKYVVIWYFGDVVLGSDGGYIDTFLLGAIGKAFRVSDTQIDFYEIIEGTEQGVLALRITQAEIDEALEAAGEATCVKASVNDRASVTVWADGNVTLSIGPDYESKIFHVLLEGGLGGPIIGHSTTYGPPAGAHCPN